MSAHDDTREILWAAVRRPGLREWTISMLVGSPTHASEIDRYITGCEEPAVAPGERATLPGCLARYEATATVIVAEDGISGDMIVTAKTEARDEKLVAEFVSAAVLAASNSTTQPPAGWHP